MALNKFMHPRNVYKDNAPDFAELAEKYSIFKKYVQVTKSGKAFINFRNPNAVRTLSQCLLEKDFNLKVNIPSDRLAPTIPLRLNYILWLQDLLNCLPRKDRHKILDIGCGSSCIYPLLGCRTCPTWHFIASEADDKNFEYAAKNIKNNSLAHRIDLMKVSKESPLLNYDDLDACMCNPPFYSCAEELASRSDRPMANSSNSGDKCELVGGDLNFAKRMFLESINCQNRSTWYTIMLGKKSSFTKFKLFIEGHGVRTKVCSEFCQGNTMRWGIAWSFSEIDVSLLPKLLKKSSQAKSRKSFCFTSKFTTIEESLSATKSLLDKLAISFVLEDMKFILKGNLCAMLQNRKERRKEQFLKDNDCAPPNSKILKEDKSWDAVTLLTVKPVEFGPVDFELVSTVNGKPDMLNRFYLHLRQHFERK